jgi:SAM-dependent methyltransferase
VDVPELDGRKGSPRAHEPVAVAPVVGTEQHLLGVITHLASVKGDDLLVDLGCGDGRLLVHAALRCRCKCLGVDVRASCLEDTRRAAEAAGVSHLVRALEFDMMNQTALERDLPEWKAATVIYAYLVPAVIRRLEAVLRRAVDDGKVVILYCSSGSRVRRSNAPAAGNIIGDLQPATQAVMGRLRLYARDDVLAARGIGGINSTLTATLLPVRSLPALPALPAVLGSAPRGPPLDCPPASQLQARAATLAIGHVGPIGAGLSAGLRLGPSLSASIPSSLPASLPALPMRMPNGSAICMPACMPNGSATCMRLPAVAGVLPHALPQLRGPLGPSAGLEAVAGRDATRFSVLQSTSQSRVALARLHLPCDGIHVF